MQAAKRNYVWHLWLGAVAPLVFYVHSTHVGYGTSLLLSSVYLGNAALALLHTPLQRLRSRIVKGSWLFTHVSLSILVVFLACYHMVFTFLYE
jgi:hypothetical protein